MPGHRPSELTPCYITVAWQGQTAAAGSARFPRGGVMVPPTGDLPLKAAAEARNGRCGWEYIDDYGGLDDRYACDALNCV